MATFFRKSNKVGVIGVPRRRFVVRDVKPSVSLIKANVDEEVKKVEPEIGFKRPVGRPRKVELVSQLAVESLDEGMERFENSQVTEKSVKTLRAIDKLINKPVLNNEMVASGFDDGLEENAVFEDDESLLQPTKQAMVEAEHDEYQKRQNKAIEEQLKALEAEKAKEKRLLEKEIRELKQELHRTAPITDNKFFSLSKNLRDSVEEITKLALAEGIPVEINELSKLTDKYQGEAIIDKVIAVPKIETDVVVNPASKVVLAELKADEVKAVEVASKSKTLPAKKTLLSGLVVTILMIGSFGIVNKFLSSKPEVDQAMVDSYLQKSQIQTGSVQGATTTSNSEPQDPSQAEVSFESSIWENFNDVNFGVMMQFPKNAVKPIRTESNITFVRKTGYLFKVQRIETALTTEEYWKQIKATSLNYKVSTEKFKDKEALKLILEDVADYPGNRYLVKSGNFIYDIWFATESSSFAKDDILRVEKMLASLNIVEAK